MKITIITISNVALNYLIKIHEEMEEIHPKVLNLKLYNCNENLSENQWNTLFMDVEDSEVVLVDIMGSSMENHERVTKACSLAKGKLVFIDNINSDIEEFITFGDFNMKDIHSRNFSNAMYKDYIKKIHKRITISEKLGSIIPLGKLKDIRNLSHIRKYWINSREEDFRNLLYLLMRDYGNIKEFPRPEEPIEVHNINFYSFERNKTFKTFKDFSKIMEKEKEKPNILFLFNGYNYPIDTMSEVKKIYKKFKKDFNIIPLIFPTSYLKRDEELEEIIRNLDLEIELIINFLPFRIGAGPMGGDVSRSLELLRLLNVPLIHPVFITGNTKRQCECTSKELGSYEFLVSIMLPELDGAIDMIPVGALDVKENKEKYGVTLRELNVIEERVEKLRKIILNIIKLRKKENCHKKVAIICYNYPYRQNNLFEGDFLDTFKSVENILEQLKIEGYDVELTHSNMLRELFLKERRVELKKETFTPGIIRGNVFIGVQPSRVLGKTMENTNQHRKLLYEEYLTFYNYIKEEFKADVIINVGTHGTMEFSKDKEYGILGENFLDIVTGYVPQLYLYYTGNTSEAMIIRRRYLASLIGYKPPVFVESELYDEFAKIEELFNKYYEAEKLNPSLCTEILQEIKLLSLKNNLEIEGLKDIEKEIYRMKNSLIPKGLHVFGKPYSREEALDYVREVFSFNRPSKKSLNSLIASLRGEDYEKLLNKNKIKEVQRIKEDMKKILNSYINHGEFILEKTLSNRKIIEEIENELICAKLLYNDVLYSHEFSGLLKGLSSKYIPSKLAADVIRNPEVMPTGYNLHQIDPYSIPSNFALNRGIIIAQNTIENYKENNHSYPESVATVLWGLETSRTGGETLAQVLWYLGVRVKSNSRGLKNKFEIIPIEELKRPRIDVVINLCGFFREMFPNIIEDITRLLVEIINLNEDDNMNYIKKHSKIIYRELIKNGFGKEVAKELSEARIFGPTKDEYGTSIINLIENKNWNKEEDIGKSYLDSMSYLYNVNYIGEKSEKLFKRNLSFVDIVSQIRSNHEYEVIDLDNYYEFFGGLSKAIEICKGTKAEMYITDTTGEEILTEEIEKSINRGVRTRLLNLKWIEALLEHDYHGGSQINKRFQNILGLSVTTNKVKQWVYNKMFHIYVEDEALKERIKENNKLAYMEMLNFMLEYNKRGYWHMEKYEKEKIKQEILSLKVK